MTSLSGGNCVRGAFEPRRRIDVESRWFSIRDEVRTPSDLRYPFSHADQSDRGGPHQLECRRDRNRSRSLSRSDRQIHMNASYAVRSIDPCAPEIVFKEGNTDMRIAADDQ